MTTILKRAIIKKLNTHLPHINNYYKIFGKRYFSSFSDPQSKKNELPNETDVIVIGGGIIGVNVAYHLSLLNIPCILLEQGEQLTAGTTWHAAGLMTQFGSMSETSTRMRQYALELYSTIEQTTGLSTGLKRNGFIEVASNPDRLEEYRRVAAFNKFLDVPVEEISPSDVKQLFPLCRVDDILAGFYVPGDGRVNPVDATMSIAKAAKMNNAKIFTNSRAIKIDLNENNNAVHSVLVEDINTQQNAEIRCKTLVNCAGLWANSLGLKNGINIPNQAAEHYYLITDKIEGVTNDLPVLEDPSSYGYYREEGGGLLIGLFEPIAKAWRAEETQATDFCKYFSFGSIPSDFDRMTPFLEVAMDRIPISKTIGMKTFFCGPESFTPDLAPIVGPIPNVHNYFVCAGLNSVGIIHGPGLGKLIAFWIQNGYANMDITGMNCDRFFSYQNNIKYREERIAEALGLVYKCHYPTRVYETVRGCKKSIFYQRHAEKNAYFKETSGWESPDWFGDKNDNVPKPKLTWNIQETNYWKYWQREHKCIRENVGLIDMSFMSKFLIQGNDKCGEELNYLCNNDINKYNNMITYTQWLDEYGYLQGDLTVTKLNEKNKFLVVITDTQHGHALNWMNTHFKNGNTFVTDVTGGFQQLNVQGPNARKLMEKLTCHDMCDEHFPFRTAKYIDIGLAQVLCTRITYVGELGYELFIPTEHALHVYDFICEIGQEFDLMQVGLKALGSLRMEKGYRDYGHDMDNTDTVIEAGLGFNCDYNKPNGFLGKEPTLIQKNKGVSGLDKRLVQVLVNDPIPMLYHNEVLLRDDRAVGYIRCASYGHTLGGAVGLALCEENVTMKNIKLSKWEIIINNVKYDCTVSLKPLYDAENLKIKSKDIKKEN
eukprot:163023_1